MTKTAHLTLTDTNGTLSAVIFENEIDELKVELVSESVVHITSKNGKFTEGKVSAYGYSANGSPNDDIVVDATTDLPNRITVVGLKDGEPLINTLQQTTVFIHVKTDDLECEVVNVVTE